MLPFFYVSRLNILMTYDLFSDSVAGSCEQGLATSRNIPLKDAAMCLVDGFLTEHEARILFNALRAEINWQQEQIVMYGKSHPVPRLSAWYGDAGVSYSYSGISASAISWTPSLKIIKQKIEAFSQCRFNGVLINLYRDGQDGVSWHSDDEVSLGVDPVVASLSLGETRRFQLKHRSEDNERYAMDLRDGCLLIMQSGMQKHWLHQVPKSRRSLGERINLTFRLVV